MLGQSLGDGRVVSTVDPSNTHSGRHTKAGSFSVRVVLAPNNIFGRPLIRLFLLQTYAYEKPAVAGFSPGEPLGESFE